MMLEIATSNLFNYVKQPNSYFYWFGFTSFTCDQTAIGLYLQLAQTYHE